jgi:hypothetical protein
MAVTVGRLAGRVRRDLMVCWQVHVRRLAVDVGLGWDDGATQAGDRTTFGF